MFRKKNIKFGATEYQLVFAYIKQFEKASLKIFLNRTYDLYLKGYHLKQEICYLEKVFIRNNNFLRCLVKQMMKNVHNGKADPYTTTSLTTEEPFYNRISTYLST